MISMTCSWKPCGATYQGTRYRHNGTCSTACRSASYRARKRLGSIAAEAERLRAHLGMSNGHRPAGVHTRGLTCAIHHTPLTLGQSASDVWECPGTFENRAGCRVRVYIDHDHSAQA